MNLVDDENIGEKLKGIINTVSEVISVISADSGNATDLKLFMRSLKLAGVNQTIVESPTITWLMMKEKIMNEYFLTYTTTLVWPLPSIPLMPVLLKASTTASSRPSSWAWQYW